VILRLRHGFKEPIENRPRGSEIGVHHREVKHLLAFNQHLMLEGL
jgi:hypothetical protein